ncbi:protein virilizer isoform X2 [Bacillus rossius redtenbacheri]|uniref:protein virilizer isoform X2 n=1 Tax=Bacillus rossius redtenbacheri TaxID=93214 RepID=UPI002FDDD368
MADSSELLFFDTFSHESSEELNLDLVQFPKPVVISEVRIIPLGARVKADFPGGVRLGATNPSQFEIEFFVNNLNKPGASTFESLGGLEYKQNVNIQLECERRILTDGLVLRGWYTTITLAVYGLMTKALQEQASPQVPLPNTAACTADSVTATAITPEWVQQHVQVPVPEMVVPSVEQNYIDPTLTPVDPYTNSYPSEQYHGPPSEYSPYDDWSQQSRPILQPPPAEDQHAITTSYDSEGLPWDSSSVAEEKLPWERDRGKERDRDRHRDRDSYRSHSRERDRDWDERTRRDDRDHDRDRSRDREYRELSWERDRERPSSRVSQRQQWNDRSSEPPEQRHSLRRLHPPLAHKPRDGSWPPSDERKRPRSPPIHSPPKMPHTPPPNGTLEDVEPPPSQQQRWSPSRSEAGIEVKKEVCSPSRQKFESLSPGDVESISEGEIPEAEGDSSPGATRVTAEPEVGTVIVAGTREDVATPEQDAKATPPPQPMQGGGTPTQDSTLAKASSTPLATPVDSPIAQDEPSLDVEPFEPILSDEEIVDESDSQFQDMEYEFTDYTDELAKVFNPFTFEIQQLVYLKDPCLSQLEAEARAGRREGAGRPEEARLEELVRQQGCTEEWVHAVELVPALLVPGLACAARKDEMLEVLLQWVGTGLDFDLALNQPQPGYKVRHIKAGVRLVEALCQCGESVVTQMIEKHSVQSRLLDVFRREHMALSIKLMILRALDATLCCRFAMERFLQTDGYRTLLSLLEGKELARIKFAITCLLRKLHTWEVLEHFKNSTRRLVESVSLTSDDKVSTPAPLCSAESLEQDLEIITVCLEEVIRTFREAPLISQPRRFLPVRSQFEVASSVQNAYSSLYMFFSCHQLLESCLGLATCPLSASCSIVICLVQEMLEVLADSQEGLVFLMARRTVTGALLRVLLQDDDSQQVGLMLACRLYTMQCIDALFYHARVSGVTDPDHVTVLEQLGNLYNLACTPTGRTSLVHVLSHGNACRVLLDLYVYQSTSIKPKESAGKSYIADIVVLTVKLSSYVPFLKMFGKELLDVALKDENTPASCKFLEVMTWLKPVENPSVFVYDDISPLTEIIKRNVENATILPGELVTTVRILKYLSIPPGDQDLVSVVDVEDSESCVELKYKHVILQLFSLDGVAHLTTILQRLCELYEQPALHATSFVTSQGATLVSFVLPAIQLLRRMLTYVIRCRNTNFKDLTAVPILLQTFTLMYSFPVTSPSFGKAQLVCREIVEILLAFTQPVSEDPASETEALNKSLWTMVVAEVIKYVTTAPYTFISGLLIVSEMLPLPLPVQTRLPLPEEEIVRTVNARKLWSAHLHSLGSSLQELIATMSSSSFQPLLQLLRRVCVQLADLAAPTALVVSRGVLDTVLSSLHSLPQAAEVPMQNGRSPSSEPVLDAPCTGHTARLLNFLACLVTHASIKCAVMQLITRCGPSMCKADEQYPALIVVLCSILVRPSDNPAHVQAQECVVSVIQSLCDIDVTLLPPPGTILSSVLPSPEVYLSNALPPGDLLSNLCSILLEHISNVEHSFTTLLPTVRTFLMLTEHDYGFYHLRSCLEKRPDSLRNLFLKFCQCFSKDSSDCLSTLSTSLELLRVLVTPDEEEGRAAAVPAPELAAVLDWHRPGGDAGAVHPISTLKGLLQECSSEEEALESLHENVAGLVRLLEEEGSKPMEQRDMVEPLLPPPETLLAQFAARPVFVVGEVDDERLSSTYWLAPPPVDEADQDMEQVTCDLVEMMRQHLPDFNLPVEAERLFRRLKDMDGEDDEGKKRGDELAKYLVGDSKNKRPFVAPMRGRGFGRSQPQRGDLFRSRPPNTSRPPSLHVDDFVALEISGQQPTGPTGYNIISMRAAKDIISTRTRGRGRAFPTDRGRFFGSSAAYSRHENGRGEWTEDSQGLARSLGSMAQQSSAAQPWPLHGSEGSSPAAVAVQRQFRTSELHDARGGRFGVARGPRGGWTVKDGRERFGGPPVRGGMHRDPSGRHIRTFMR